MNSFVLYPAVKICRVRALKVPTFGSHYFLRLGDQFSLSNVTCDQEFFFWRQKEKNYLLKPALVWASSPVPEANNVTEIP